MKKIFKRIIIGIAIAALSSCASTHQTGHYDLWDSYKSCAAYGNP